MEIAEFLLARIAEDEAAARAAILPIYGQTGEWHTFDDKDDLAKTVVFASNCEAKRRIVEAESRSITRRIKPNGPPMPELKYTADGVYIYCTDPAPPSMTLRLLALPYADHVDYDPEWKP